MRWSERQRPAGEHVPRLRRRREERGPPFRDPRAPRRRVGDGSGGPRRRWSSRRAWTWDPHHRAPARRGSRRRLRRRGSSRRPCPAVAPFHSRSEGQGCASPRVRAIFTTRAAVSAIAEKPVSDSTRVGARATIDKSPLRTRTVPVRTKRAMAPPNSWDWPFSILSWEPSRSRRSRLAGSRLLKSPPRGRSPRSGARRTSARPCRRARDWSGGVGVAAAIGRRVPASAGNTAVIAPCSSRSKTGSAK